MKKAFVVIAVLAIALLVASAAMAGIRNTKHDLSSSSLSGGYKSGTDQICEFCHTPHDASTAAPLWNRTAPNSGNAYTNLYSSASLSATPGDPQGTISAACLSCHDGTLATQAVINQPGSGDLAQGTDTPNVINGTLTNGAAALGTDLRNDHPVSFDYDTAAGVKARASVNASIKFFGSAADQVECASCHSVHDDTNKPFLRMSNSQSALCLACHDK